MCLYCRKGVSGFESFCSKDCETKFHKSRIKLSCNGCKKDIEVYPHLVRKTNYCSLDCYHISTYKKNTKNCIICHKKFHIKEYLVKQGYGFYCSRQCQHKSYSLKRIRIFCKFCKKEIFKPPSVAKKTVYCSLQCHNAYMRDYVTKICRDCNKSFEIPNWEVKKGKGSFCSRKCFYHFKGETSIEMMIRVELENLKIEFQQEVKFGVYHADFFLADHGLIIECDGHFWHSTQKAKDRDTKKDQYLRKLGYKIVRFTGSQIYKSSSRCVEQALIYASTAYSIDKQTK